MEKQYQSAEIKDLAAALAKAQGEMGHASKAVENTFFRSRYADLPAVIDAAKPHLAKHNLSVTQITDIDEQGKMVLITQLMHSSGQWLRSWYPINPVKSDPQGLGSAVSYSRRYSYCAMTGIAASGEDDDGNAASGNIVSKKESAVARNKRFDTLKKMILTSDDPAATWHDNMEEIDGFREEDKTYYEDLVAAGKKRKQELIELENAKASGLLPRE